MKICKSWNPRHTFIEARIVLHRAGAQRVHANVDRVVPGRHANEVTDDINFADFGHAFKIVVTTKLGGDSEIGFLDVERGKPVSNATRLRPLEDELLVRSEERRVG